MKMVDGIHLCVKTICMHIGTRKFRFSFMQTLVNDRQQWQWVEKIRRPKETMGKRGKRNAHQNHCKLCCDFCLLFGSALHGFHCFLFSNYLPYIFHGQRTDLCLHFHSSFEMVKKNLVLFFIYSQFCSWDRVEC